MNRWAQSSRFHDSVQFISVCVDSKGVAFQFNSMFGLDQAGVINCWIPDRRYFPVGFGQLGCSGFIVSDENGMFVSRKTKAYLQYGDAAFDDVDDILSKLLLAAKKKQKRDTSVSGSSISTVVDDTPPPPRKKEMRRDVPVPAKTKQGEEKKTELIETMEAPSSVGVKSMDDDHEQCAIAISQLLKTKSVQSLELVSKELEEHFRHEEALMKEYNFGNAQDESDASAFSAYTSHVKDHKRILTIISREMSAVSLIRSSCCHSASGSVVCDVSASPSASAATKVDEGVIMEIVNAFHTHSETFDVLYADHIPATAA